jgi:hypothetical protein
MSVRCHASQRQLSNGLVCDILDVPQCSGMSMLFASLRGTSAPSSHRYSLNSPHRITWTEFSKKCLPRPFRQSLAFTPGSRRHALKVQAFHVNREPRKLGELPEHVCHIAHMCHMSQAQFAPSIAACFLSSGKASHSALVCFQVFLAGSGTGTSVIGLASVRST